MKTLLLVIFLTINFFNKSNSQELPEGGDVFMSNSSSKNVWVRVYPVSMVFNVDIYGDGNYDFQSMSPLPLFFNYINGKGINSTDGKYLLIPNGGHKSWNMEGGMPSKKWTKN